MATHRVTYTDDGMDKHPVPVPHSTYSVAVSSPDTLWLYRVVVRIEPAVPAKGRRRASPGRVTVDVQPEDENAPLHTLTVFESGAVTYSA